MSIDGLIIRPLTTADRSALAQLPTRVSPPSAIMRFHGALTSLSEPLLDRLLDLEDGQREAVVAVDGDDIVGVARFARDPASSETAEIAILVADAWQHHGVAQALMRPLIDSAASSGIRRLRGDMLAENTAAQRFVSGLGPVVDHQVVEGHLVVTVDVSADQA